ncbi:helix-turn-helix domain-containing protein [Amycolatopsis roodepoortensis]|uniref:helix-turn-helix domain-containing protein n=1 Tax=Amycolatopsis roodepoortensis TaxID=700274 RepID=UPI00214BFEDC|nr:helix-turn-helix transcriptional regulator [Amycolatopsis roodepoortensis]UUV36487.1 helix-turn-helix domain-containing protein [Amycolatopsis roodepoortensis]
MSDSVPDSLLQAVKLDVGRRLKFARTNHPNGSMTQAALAEATGVSTRALGDIETGSSNPNLETLVKITAGLGVDRLAYLLDEAVFDQVNSEFESVRETAAARKELGVTSFAFRADSKPDLSNMDINSILHQLQTWVAAKQGGTHDGGSPRP